MFVFKGSFLFLFLFVFPSYLCPFLNFNLSLTILIIMNWCHPYNYVPKLKDKLLSNLKMSRLIWKKYKQHKCKKFIDWFARRVDVSICRKKEDFIEKILLFYANFIICMSIKLRYIQVRKIKVHIRSFVIKYKITSFHFKVDFHFMISQS
jgi:hypothetical protein